MDDDFQTYLNRLARMTRLEAYQIQVQNIQESYKYQKLPTGERQAAPFPGYTIITPPSEEDDRNAGFYKQLQEYQVQLLNLPIASQLLVPLPTGSFHLTLADLIWDNAYRDACDRNPNYESDLRSCCTSIFQQYRQNSQPATPIRFSILGVMLMPRAIAVCLVPQERSSYEQIISFRRTIYQNSQLMPLGIEQNYHLTAHVTLGYFGEMKPDLDRQKLVEELSELNEKWLGNSPEFLVHRGELRKFDDMTRYYRQPDWAAIDF
ncbi:DUF1868 domain-containing protein [Calothrix sp. UHCC 0171]|uniref:DUF1868 domain-containing protein n=1 Tax=Calothrix sp. UHCC 0171 TaxID=3110245 RepID=UPI002B1F7C41|nr:DUF1868 domain-containing protein [Calothrix sp. UHCC 0171]MEA5571422.1 DUF1868 domain-containing protein [Calothrix sp. UHCC 0171]